MTAPDPVPVPPTPMQIVGARIRDLRISHRMTQGALASKCFVHQVTVSEWERGLKTPGWLGSPSNRELVAQALGLPVTYVFREVLDDEARRAVA